MWVYHEQHSLPCTTQPSIHNIPPHHKIHPLFIHTGYAAIRAAYPYLCTVSVKPNAIKRYPGEIIAGLLYLGDWDNARDVERLRELNIKTVVCVLHVCVLLCVLCVDKTVVCFACMCVYVGSKLCVLTKTVV